MQHQHNRSKNIEKGPKKRKTNKRTMDLFHNDFLLQHIVGYVGDHQFRFIAGISHNFYQAYTTVHSRKVTYYNVTSKELAKFCHDDMPVHDANLFGRDSLCAIAALQGRLDVVQYLQKMDGYWDKRTCPFAAYNGHLDVLQWCRQNGCPWDDAWVCKNAAGNGHLHILQWCHGGIGCAWDSTAVELAAARGHLEVVQWLRSHGCPWHRLTCREAASAEHWDVVHWCRRNGCSWDIEGKYSPL
jgi:ankyrin repeat protein